MATTSEVKRGMIIMMNNEPTLIIDREFYKPGKGGAFNRLKLKGLKSGRIVNQTLRSGEMVEEVEVNSRNVSYSYSDADNAYFMDPVTFDMITVSMNLIEGGTNFLMPDAKYIVQTFEEDPIALQLPAKITLIVTETASGGDRGNTSGNALKEATMETGVVIRVPLFVNTGDRIIINTETGEYVSKDNK